MCVFLFFFFQLFYLLKGIIIVASGCKQKQKTVKSTETQTETQTEMPLSVLRLWMLQKQQLVVHNEHKSMRSK